MTAAEKSFIGLAKQDEKGTPNTTDAEFNYLLFRAGGVAPQNIVLPLDAEVGGGAMLRDMVKVGVTSGGALDIIPRPDTLGHFLLGAMGDIETANEDGESFKLKSDAIMADVYLQSIPQTGYDIGISSPPTTRTLIVKGTEGGEGPLAGTVTVYGTDALDAPLEEDFILDGDEYIVGEEEFKTVTEVDLPVRVDPGDMVRVGWDDPAYRHLFKLPTDQFDAPYYTVRSAPGQLWGEQFQDCRVAGLAITFAGARFVEGAVTFMGGLPTPVSIATWDALTYLDEGPQFLAPTSLGIELPPATGLKVLSGSVAWGLAIPLDEQWVVGSYSPDDFDINQRSMVITMAVKLTSDTLYKKLMYDGVGAVSEWTAEIYREGQMQLSLRSPIEASTGNPYELTIRAHDTEDNIVWSAAPIGLRAGRQIVMAVTGVVLNTSAGNPIEVELVNTIPAY